MIKSLFGPSSVVHALRGGLDKEMAMHKTIAGRVSGALSSSSRTDFSKSLAEASGRKASTETDLQRDMAALANTQIRYEVEAELLQRVYKGLRSAIQ
jgi:flagellar basal body rod protein FlgB